MENIVLERRKVFFHNLILLGMNTEDFEKKYKVSFHKDMFLTPNKKGFEAITHFLFSKLSAVTQEDYRLPWPLIDIEACRMFQKTCYAHIITFSKEGIVRFPQITPSFLSMFGGERFYEIYMAFTTYVLCKMMKSEGCSLLSRPFLTRDNFNAVQNILQLSCIFHAEAVRKTQYITYANQCVWVKLTKNLSQCLEDLKKALISKRKLKKRDLDAIKSLLNIPPGENLYGKKLLGKIFEFYKVGMRDKVEKFYSRETELWKYMESEIGSNSESQILNGQNLKTSFLESVPENLYLEIQRIGDISLTVDGKFSVLRFMKLLFIYLKFMIQILEKVDLSKLQEDCSVENVLDIEDSLKCSVQLLERLYENEIPVTKRNIKTLKLETKFDSYSNTKSLAQLPLRSFNSEALSERLPNLEPGELFPLLYPDLLTTEEGPASASYLESLESVITSRPRDNLSPTKLKRCPPTEIITPDKMLLKEVLDEESLSPTSFLKKYKIHADNMASTPEISISDFDSMPFKMRNSWLLEPSLDSETIPDVSLDDSTTLFTS